MSAYYFKMAVIATIGGMGGVCILVLVADWFLGNIAAWREKRAMAKRDADMSKWNILAYPSRSRMIPNSQIDPSHITGQFSVPRSMRDCKGVTR